MTSKRAHLSVVLLLSLLALAQVQAGLAVFGVIWRTAVLSWDDPDTQLVEDLASQAAPVANPSRLARDRLLSAAQAHSDVELPDSSDALQHPARNGRITRSPPLA